MSEDAGSGLRRSSCGSPGSVAYLMKMSLTGGRMLGDLSTLRGDAHVARVFILAIACLLEKSFQMAVLGRVTSES